MIGAPDGSAPRAGPRPRAWRYFDLIAVGFVTVLLCANFFAPAKVVLALGVTFGVGNVFFPISYVFGDVLTEVYGYARARRVIWTGFVAMLFAAAMAWLVIALPPDPSASINTTMQPAVETVLGLSPRVVVASILGFVVGDLLNSYVLARMKVWTRGRWLWTRTIGSTVVGQAADSVIFYPVAFYGVWSDQVLGQIIVNNWLIKVGVEVVMTPLTYWVVGTLKRAEGGEVYDEHTDFTPFSMRV